MLIVHEGKRCYGCPFFNLEHVVEYGELMGSLPVCSLDGLVPSGEPPLTIKIEDPEVQPGTCPFQDPHGISVEVTNG